MQDRKKHTAADAPPPYGAGAPQSAERAGPAPENTPEQTEKKRRFAPSLTAPLLVLGVFVLLLLVRLISPGIFDRDNEVILLTVVQVLIFMVPAVIYIRTCRMSFRRLRFVPFGLNSLLLVISAVVAASAGSLLLGFAASGYDDFSKTYTLYGAFSAPSGGGTVSILYLATVYAALPAFCEEFVFRSVMCAEYESDSGSFSAVVLTAVWFAMLHFDLQSFPVYFFSGILLALTLYSARSFFAAFCVHLGYNLISLFAPPLWRTVYDAGGKTLYFLIVGLLFLLSMVVFCGEAARLYGWYSDNDIKPDYRRQIMSDRDTDDAPRGGALKRALAGNLRAFLAPSALLCYLIYIAVMLFIK